MDRDYSKLGADDAPWLTDPSAIAVCDAIGVDGHQVLFVGGCVRNALLGMPVHDIDIATSALPEEVIAYVKAAGLKSVPTGIDHGTVTVVSGGKGYEVTTFRRDIETNGRHAVVAYSRDIEDDARRRDFTMNALYAMPDGTVIDPLDGLDDLVARRVRFIEDAGQRVREDYLRALRFFRFHAWYGNTDAGMVADALAAIAAHLCGLETLSAERVGAEMRKLLSAPDPSMALAAMGQTGVTGTLFPGADARFVPVMIHSEEALGLVPNWIGRLVALGGTQMPERLRLSKADRRTYEAIQSAVSGGAALLETAFEHDAETAIQVYLISCAYAERLADPDMVTRIKDTATRVFPVTASDLMPRLQGRALGDELARLKTAWIASEFGMSKADLLALSQG